MLPVLMPCYRCTSFTEGTLLEAIMDDIKDYVLCDNCKNKNFIRIYNFAVHYKRVNFSDDVIYDEVSEELYQCTHCQKTFSKHQINARLKEMADERLRSLSEH
jgi:ribosomal protein L37AE/L43A